MRLENKFKTEKLIPRLKEEFEGCMILHLDPNEVQGIPDLLILHDDKWAALEAKKSCRESSRPNQHYYVGLMNNMSYSSFVYPENLEEVIYELQQTFQA